MSYAKAMKHARNVRKCRAQARMHFGFDTGRGPLAPGEQRAVASFGKITQWFHERHNDEPGSPAYRLRRECVHELVAEMRAGGHAPRAQLDRSAQNRA